MSLLVRKPGVFGNMPALFADLFDNNLWPFQNGESWISEIPAANIQEKENEYLIELAVPGMKKEDFNLDVNNGILNISSRQESESEKTEDGFSRKEFNYSAFSRSFTLPENVDEDEIKASYNDGILLLNLPKGNEPEKSKKAIKIE